MKIPLSQPKPEIWWALYNYGRLMGVKPRRKDLADLFVGGMPEFIADIRNGTVEARRCLVTPSK